MKKSTSYVLCTLLCMILAFTVLPMDVMAMTINCKDVAGNSTSLEVEANDSIDSVIARLRDKINNYSDTILLTYQGHILEENRTLADYMIEEDETLHILIRLKPCSHEVLQPFAGHAATCETDGVKDAFFCSNCNKYFEDAEAAVEIGDETAYAAWAANAEQGLIKAAGHSITEKEAQVPATCDADGHLAYRQCDNCGNYFDEKDALIGDSDALVTWMTAGDGLLKATGHTWDKGTVTQEATWKADGIKTYTCTACSKTKETSIPFKAPKLKMLEGESGNYTLTSESIISMRCSGDFSLFESLVVDGNTLIPGNDFDAVEGSTVVTFRSSWLEKQKPGTHDVVFYYKDGSSCSAKLIITAPPADKSSPGNSKSGKNTDFGSGAPTGDTSLAWFFLLLLILSAGTALAALRKNH